MLVEALGSWKMVWLPETVIAKSVPEVEDAKVTLPVVVAHPFPMASTPVLVKDSVPFAKLQEMPDEQEKVVVAVQVGTPFSQASCWPPTPVPKMVEVADQEGRPVV